MAITRGARGPSGGGSSLSDSTPQPLGVAAAGVSTSASRADHVHALPTIPALSSTTPAALGVAAVGVGTTAARADHVHALPSGFVAGATTAEDMTGTGWTTTQPGNVTATWASSKLTLSAPLGANTITFATSNTSRLGASSSQWDSCQRIDMVAGDGASPAAQFLSGFYVDDNNYILASYKTDTRTIGLFTKAAGSATDHGFVSGPSSGQATGGELWIRVSRLVSGEVAVWWGVGTSGALPTAWTRTHLIDRAALTLAVPSSCSIYSGFGWFGFGALSTTTTVDVLAIRTTWQGSL